MRRSAVDSTAIASPKASTSAENVLFDETMRLASSQRDAALAEEVSRRRHTAIEGPRVGRGNDITDRYDRRPAAIDIADRTPRGE